MVGSGRTASLIAVIMGGPSAEREVSLSSGRGCAAALRDAGYKVVEVDAGRDLPARLAEISPDVVFNTLHGRWGEDGCVQGLLEWLGLAYTHSGVLSSALAMDKLRTKYVFEGCGLPTPAFRAMGAVDEADSILQALTLPLSVKPSREGSSIGIRKVASREELIEAYEAAAVLDPLVLVEEWVEGPEFTVSLLQNRPLPAIGLSTDHVFYDYDAKYTPGGSRHVVPADLPPEIFDACMDYARRAHAVLGCRGLSRTDFRWDESRGKHGLILLETNTQPGMTPTSLSPEQGQAVGISFPELCAWMVEDASCDR